MTPSDNFFFNIFPPLLTRRRCAGCWRWAAPDTLWWRSPRCCCSSGSPDTGARRAGLPPTPWGRTRARTTTSRSPPCPPAADPHLHPSRREEDQGVSGWCRGFTWAAERDDRVDLKRYEGKWRSVARCDKWTFLKYHIAVKLTGSHLNELMYETVCL